MAKFRSVPIFYITEKVVSVLVSGYIPTNKDPLKSKFEFGPMNTAISGNAIEEPVSVWEEQQRRHYAGTVFDGYMAVWNKREKLKI